MFEGYKGKIVHVIGGMHDFMGEIDAFCSEVKDDNGYSSIIGDGKHPNGDGWIRIKNPCLVKTVEQKNAVGELISKLGGPQDVYEAFVDLYIPPGESLVEIRVLNENGGLHEAYMKQIKQPKIENIVVPGMKGFFNPPQPKQ